MAKTYGYLKVTKKGNVKADSPHYEDDLEEMLELADELIAAGGPEFNYLHGYRGLIDGAINGLEQLGSEAVAPSSMYQRYELSTSAELAMREILVDLHKDNAFLMDAAFMTCTTLKKIIAKAKTSKKARRKLRYAVLEDLKHIDEYIDAGMHLMEALLDSDICGAGEIRTTPEGFTALSKMVEENAYLAEYSLNADGKLNVEFTVDTARRAKA